MKKILYIEPSKMFQMMIGDMLEKYGYSIIGAKSSQEAIDIINTEEINCILTAYLLEDMNAENFIKILDNKEINNCPIILISSFDEIKNVKNFFRIGITDYILKQDLNKDDTLGILLKDLA